MKIISIILMILLNLVYANEVKFYQPSFDCSKVKENSVEYEICTNKDLSDWDKVLTEIYEKILKEIPKKEELKNDQREFLKDREICNEQNNKVSCIEESYKNRIYTINNIFALSNINLANYKSQKIKDTKNFIQLNDEIKSHLFINTFLDKIDIFEKKNYILLENGFLFKDLYSRGIYYANSQTGKMKKIYDWVEPWVFIKNSKPIKLAVKNSGGSSGKGYENIAIITIKDKGNTEDKTIIETQYDMESGLCGRAEELRLTKAGDIENFKYNEENNQLVIDFTEQDCSNKEITKKQLVYDLQSEDIDNLNKIAKNKTSKFSKIETEIENDKFEECMANSSGSSRVSECTKPIIEKYENKIKSLDAEVINSIRTTKKGFYDELFTYDNSNIKELRLTLENIYKENAQSWEKHKLTYFKFIDNTYEIQDGTMWSGVGDMRRITFLKNRIKEILDIKNKIEQGN